MIPSYDTVLDRVHILFYIKPGFIMIYLALMSKQCKINLPKNCRGTIVMVPSTITMVPPDVPDC